MATKSMHKLVGQGKATAEFVDTDGVASLVMDGNTISTLTGITATAAELNTLDGITATTAELNILDGVTSTTAELNILDGVTSTAAELNILDGVTATAAEINYLDLTTGPGTQEASKAVVADANVNTGVSKVTELHIGASGSEVQVTATPAEINRAADLTGRVVSVTATGSVTEAAHEGREVYITGTAANTQTLPEATGSGGRYRFIIGEVNTNGTVLVVADTTNANFIGSVNILDLDASAQGAFGCPANCDTITLNGTTTGGQIGDFIELVDVATDVWMVTGQLQVPTGSNIATPFSAAV